MKRDIVATWPKTKPLEDYLADREELWINYRVASIPHWQDEICDHGWNSWPFGVERPKCFMVYDGAVRGWLEVMGACWRENGEVEGWNEGWYIVRDPTWHPIEPLPMKGFQGWRWYGT